MRATCTDIVFRWLSLATLGGAAYHLAGILGYLPTNISPIWRHALFVVIDLAAAAYLIFRPLWALPLFLALTVQQSTTHGSNLVRALAGDHKIEWLSLAVLTMLYSASTLLLLEAKRRFRRASVD